MNFAKLFVSSLPCTSGLVVENSQKFHFYQSYSVTLQMMMNVASLLFALLVAKSVRINIKVAIKFDVADIVRAFKD